MGLKRQIGLRTAVLVIVADMIGLRVCYATAQDRILFQWLAALHSQRTDSSETPGCTAQKKTVDRRLKNRIDYRCSTIIN